MPITIRPLYEAYIDANRVIRMLRNGAVELGDVFVASEGIVGQDRYPRLHAEQRTGSAHMSRCSLPEPPERAIGTALDDVERYEGSNSELLALLSR